MLDTILKEQNLTINSSSLINLKGEKEREGSRIINSTSSELIIVNILELVCLSIGFKT